MSHDPFPSAGESPADRVPLRDPAGAGDFEHQIAIAWAHLVALREHDFGIRRVQVLRRMATAG